MKHYGRFFTAICLAGLLVSCGHRGAEGDGHDHGHEEAMHEGHDHEHEGHDHESEGEEHDHDHGHEAAEHSHGDEIKLSAESATRFGVEVTELRPGAFTKTLKVSGQIEPSATDRTVVTARRSGIITLAAGITPGVHVGAGASLGTISSRGLQGGDAAEGAVIAREAAKKELDRLTPLYKEGIVTAGAYNEALKNYKEAEAAAGVKGGSAAVTTPAAGTISSLSVSSGEYVETGAPIAVVTRNSRLTLRADVPERHYSRLASVNGANFRPDYTTETFSLSDMGGRLLSSPSASPARGGYIPVYFTFESGGAVAPGAYAEIWLKSGRREGVLSVPRGAIIEMQGNYYVYTREHDDAYKKNLVKTGASDGVNVEILSGLHEGDKVVTRGATVVRMAETSAVAPPGHSHNH